MTNLFFLSKQTGVDLDFTNPEMYSLLGTYNTIFTSPAVKSRSQWSLDYRKFLP